MSGEGHLPSDGRDATVTNPAKVNALRQLVHDMREILATATFREPMDRTTMRLAANELSALADALEAGGGVANGFAAVPLLDSAVLPAPVPPPCAGLDQSPGLAGTAHPSQAAAQ